LGPERLTAFVLVLDLDDRITRGERAGDHGYKIPAIRYAERSGQKERTVARHLRTLAKRGLIGKVLVRESTIRTGIVETIAGDTGEITRTNEVVRGTRDANYLQLPSGGLPELIGALTAYSDSGTPETAPAQSDAAPPVPLEPPTDGGGSGAENGVNARRSPVSQVRVPETYPTNTVYSGASFAPESSRLFVIPEGSGVLLKPEPVVGGERMERNTKK